jgi:hypothetical protein
MEPKPEPFPLIMLVTRPNIHYTCGPKALPTKAFMLPKSHSFRFSQFEISTKSFSTNDITLDEDKETINIDLL